MTVMFEKRRERQAGQRYELALATWQGEVEELSGLLNRAVTRMGGPSQNMILKQGESVFARVTDVGIVEMRKGAGHWEGRSSGFSIPIGAGVRYRVGSSQGHYISGNPAPQSVDRGELNVTNQRAVFLGNSKTIECQFAKLLSVQWATGEVAISVTNRQKPTVVHYGAALDSWLRLRFELALAIFHGEADELANSLRGALSVLQRERPQLESRS